MAKTFISASISTGNTIEAGHVTQSSDAFTGTEAYDIIISGSLNINNAPITNLTASGGISATGNISSSGNLFGDRIVASSYLQAPQINQSIEVTGNLTAVQITASGDISSSGTTNTKFLRLPEVGASSAANGSIYFGAGPDDTNGFIYGQAGTNLTLGFDTADVVQISDNVTINTSLLFNNASHKIRTSGSIDAVTNITASGNISASGDIFAVTASLKRIELPDNASIVASPSGHKLEFNESFLKIISGDDASIQIDDTITFSNSQINILGPIIAGGTISNVSTTQVTASGHGLFQAGKPIITHTSSPISSSLANAGRYHIVHGTLTASIVLDATAPVGAEYEFFQTSSAGQFLFQSASGTTVISKNGSLRLAQQGSSAVLKKVATDTFHLMGDLT